VNYYCTCTKIKSQQYNVSRGRTPYRVVVTNKEGICTDCGHYAVACKKDIDPSDRGFREQLLGEVEAFKPKNVKGGLSLKSQKQSKGIKDGKRIDAEGEGHDGDLDV